MRGPATRQRRRRHGAADVDALHRAMLSPRRPGPAADVRPRHRGRRRLGRTGGGARRRHPLGHRLPRRGDSPRAAAPARTGGGIRMDGTHVAGEPRIHLVGYGPSASTIGANRAGQAAARSLRRLLRPPGSSPAAPEFPLQGLFRVRSGVPPMCSGPSGRQAPRMTSSTLARAGRSHDRRLRTHQDLRREDRRRRHQLHRRARPGHRFPRPQRRRQVDDDADDPRPRPAHRRQRDRQRPPLRRLPRPAARGRRPAGGQGRPPRPLGAQPPALARRQQRHPGHASTRCSSWSV